MDNFQRLIPNIILLVVTTTFCVTQSWQAAAALWCAFCLWAAERQMSKPIPEPPRTDEARFTLLEHELAETKKQLDSVKTAINMTRLR